MSDAAWNYVQPGTMGAWERAVEGMVFLATIARNHGEGSAEVSADALDCWREAFTLEIERLRRAERP